MKKLFSLIVCIFIATAIANSNVPIGGSATTVVTVDEPASVPTVTSTTPSSSGISGNGTLVAPSQYSDGVNQYYDELPPDSDSTHLDNSWMTLPFWFYYFQWLMFL